MKRKAMFSKIMLGIASTSKYLWNLTKKVYLTTTRYIVGIFSFLPVKRSSNLVSKSSKLISFQLYYNP